MTSCRVDYIRQYDRSFTTCSVDWDEAPAGELHGAQRLPRRRRRRRHPHPRQIRSAAGARQFLRLLTGHQVEIVFEQPEATVVPPSCQPAQPPGWTLDPNSNVWRK
ncbi:MAG: hypothetical protein U0703_12850 [Anaerolineae bacterium]